MRSYTSARWLLSGIAVVGILFLSAGLSAQVNTGGVRGVVIAPDGTPVAEAKVTLVHEPSQNRKETVTNADGEYAFNHLRVGGPYTVSASSPIYQVETMTGVYVSAGKNERVSVGLRPMDVIRVVASQPVGTSQKDVFDEDDIQNLPSIGRDPKDLVRLSADAYTDGDDDALSIGGVNNRFNSITIDGIRQDDDFGLQGNGYPTERSPISLSAIQEIALERSPFDVRYGNFLGGNVNIVTKSGTNEFHGSAFFNFANESLTGSKSGDEELEIEFREMTLGAAVGGPIVKDRLHFFLNVEGLDATTPSSVGAAGSGAANEVGAVTALDVHRAQQIARDVYGFDAGVPSRSLDENDLKLLAKIDWAINDQHRLSTKYQRTSGNNIRPNGASSDTLPLTSSWYDRNNILQAFSARLYSDWSMFFSTEVDVSGKILDNRQDPLNGSNFMAAEIQTADGGTIELGPDVFRHANKLDNNQWHAKVEGTYLLNNHLITGGYQYDHLQIFNLFVPFSNGVAEYDSLDDFEAQNPSNIFYLNATSNNPDDAAANWEYGIHALYLQDQWDVNHRLSVQGGARFEIYSTGAKPDFNANFKERHGFSNTGNIDGKTLLMPRLGISFRATPRLDLKAGVGLYAGGTPNVWMSNNYTNNGFSTDTEFSSDPSVISGFDGRNVPQGMKDALTPGDGSVDVLDPEFQIPSTWKASGGADYNFDIPGAGSYGKDVKVEVAYTFSKVHRGLQWVDLRRDLDSIDDNQPIGTLPDGRPYYDTDDTDGSAFDPRRGYDMMLTNTNRGFGHTASVSLAKKFDFGVSFTGAYAFQNIMEVSPANSSRSVSNYGLAAVFDPNNPDLSRSNYERTHRFVGAVQYSKPLVAAITKSSRWKNSRTSVSMFLESRSGQPYSYTFGSADGGSDLAGLFGEEREFARRERMLFYVPKGDGSDVVLNGIDEGEFNDFLSRTGLDKYRGQVAPRNAFSSGWINRIDLRFAQELPSIRGQRARLLFDIENLANLVNPSWGQYKQVPFPYMVETVDVSVDPATGRYVYSNLRSDDPERVNVLASVWRIQVGLMYEF